MPCNQDGCDIHDFPINAPWCAYKWHMERQAESSARNYESANKLNKVIETFTQLVEDLARDPKPNTYKKPESKKFRGVKL